MSALLTVERLTKSFAVEKGWLRRAEKMLPVLKEVSFSIQKGETLALVGGSGSGKSTIARILCGLIEADAGSCQWEGKPLNTFDRHQRARRIQMIFQDPFASLNPKLSVGVQLGDALAAANPELNQRQRLKEIHRLLEAVGLPKDSLGHYPFQFSGGQRQRIAIARALALRPELLIADEPLSALDVTVQAQVIELLKTLKRDGLTMLFITHDLAVAESLADRILVLSHGDVVEEGLVSAVLHHPKSEETRRLLDAIPKIPY